MADRTISLRLIPKDCSTERIQKEFKQFTVKRIRNEAQTTGRAYIQFLDPKDLERIGMKYDDCIIPALNNAEIELVEAGFNWQQLSAEPKEHPTFEVNQKCLVWLKNCDNVKGLNDATIRGAFKNFAIGKIVKFADTNQIILQFLSEDDLELLEMSFYDYKVPSLGRNAIIDLQEFNKQLFIKQYYATQPRPESIYVQKIQKTQPIAKQENQVKRQFTRQQYSEYRETIQQKQEIQRLKRQEEEAIKREEVLRKQEESKRKEEERKRVEQKNRKQAEEKTKKETQQKLRRQAEQHAKKVEAAKKQAEAKQAQLIRAKNQGEERARKFYQQKLKKAEEQARIEVEIKLKEESAKRQLQAQRKAQADLEEAAKIQRYQQLRFRQQKEEEIRQAKMASEEKIAVQKQQQSRWKRQEEELDFAKELQKETAKLIKLEQKIVQPELEKLIEQQRVQTVEKSELILNKADSNSAKKQIHLPLINTLNPSAQKEHFKEQVNEDNNTEIRYPSICPIPQVQNSIACSSYSSSLPTHFITLVLLGWVYYILMH